MIDKLYISHSLFKWNSYPKFNNFTLIDKRNLKYYLNSSENYICYTSIEDLELKVGDIHHLLSTVSAIELVGITPASFYQHFNDNQFIWGNLIDSLLHKFAQKTSGLDTFKNAKTAFRSTHVPRKNDCTLFIAGCSISHGIGVKKEERYGDLLADMFDLPVIYLSRPGSSIMWQADRILQADINSGDIVVWGLTNIGRATVADEYDWKGIPFGHYIDGPEEQKYFSIEYFSSWTLSVSTIKNILQVENFCKKIGARLYLANVLEHQIVPLVFGAQQNYINCLADWKPGSSYDVTWIDLGTDQQHPGPNQHKNYADTIYQHIQTINL
jgi:hypothetical protein